MKRRTARRSLAWRRSRPRSRRIFRVLMRGLAQMMRHGLRLMSENKPFPKNLGDTYTVRRFLPFGTTP